MFNYKKDSLVDAVKNIMEQNEREREALKIVNEAFGVHSKKALPHELHGKYDAMLEEAKKCMYEKLDPVGKENADIDNDGDVDESDGYLNNRRKAISKNMKEETILEKAVSKAQHRLMGAAYAAKKGEKPVSPKIAKIAASMSKKELKKFAGTKEKGLPEKVDESFDALNEEIRNNLLEKLNSVYETYGEQAAQYAYDTLSEEERGILSEQGFLSSLFGPNYNKFSPTARNYGAFGEPKTTPASGAAAQAARANEFLRTKGSNTITGSSTRFSSTGNVTREPTASASGVTGQKLAISNRAAEMGNDSRRDISPSVTGEPSKDLETGVSPAKPASPTPAARTPATSPKPAAPATSSQDSKPDWSRVSDGGSGSPFASEPSTTRSVRQAPERKSSSSFSRATRGDFSGITGGGGA